MSLERFAEPAEFGAPHVVDTTMFWSPTGGGVRRYLLTKNAWLRLEAGWRHTILAPRAQGPSCAASGGLSLPLGGGYRLPLERRRAADAIAAQRPDLIEAGDPYRFAWAALDAGQRCGVPTVAFCHSNLAAMASLWAGGEGRLARTAHRAAAAYLAHVYRDFDLVLAPSRAMVRALRAMGVEGARHQPLGVDTHEFHPRRRDAAWRHALGVGPNRRVLLYAGRFAPEKHLQVLAEAVERLGPRYLLLAVGQGPTPPRGAQVRVLPFEHGTRSLARIVASVDGFVHAGDQETFGLGVLEAMACGIPVAARAAGGLAELVSDGAGLAVRSNRVEDWAEAIAALFSADHAPAVRLARERAEAHDWSVVLPLLRRRYEQLMNAHAAAGAQPEETQPCVLWHSGQTATLAPPAGAISSSFGAVHKDS